MSAEERLRKLLDIIRAVTAEKDLSRLLDQVIDAVVEISGAERGFLILCDGADFDVRAARNFDGEEIRRAKEKISRTVLDRVLAQDRPVVLSDALVDPGTESLQHQKVRAVCALPLKTRAGAVGAVYLDHRSQPGVFSRDDLEILGAFAAQAAVVIESACARGELENKVRSQAVEITDLKSTLRKTSRVENIIGASKPMRNLFRILGKVIEAPYPVLISGESGTGKELVARAIHFSGPREAGPFVPANVAAIPEGLFESEVFGHVKGAFTGADRDRAGLFEQADGGTLFLDEMAAMPMGAQEKLLRVLQEGEVKRVGATQPTRVDVRVVAAANVDLALLADRGEFRADLFHRLNVLRIDLPPLRDRREDIPLLAKHFLERIARETQSPPKSLSSAALEGMMTHLWPGNVRELENALRRAAAMAEGPILEPRNLDFLEDSKSPSAEPLPLVSLDEYVLRILKERGATMDLQELAARLGLSRKTLWEKKKKLGLP